MMTGAATAFQIAMAEHGLSTTEIVADGKLHRFDGDKPGDKACWYVFHLDGVPAGAYGNWKTGLDEKWCAKQRHELTEAERDDNWRRIEDAKRQREEENARFQSKARTKANDMWAMGKPASADHAYLIKKGVSPNGLKVLNGNLLVPVVDENDTICSIQTISPDGEKRFLSGGRVKGCRFTIPGNGQLYIGEGFATMASVHAATGGTCICAFNAGNLEPVAKSIRDKHPKALITICADNDRFTAGNPGLTKGRQSADAIGAVLVHPVGCGGTDFNDFAAERGLEEVKRQIQAQSGSVVPSR